MQSREFQELLSGHDSVCNAQQLASEVPRAPRSALQPVWVHAAGLASPPGLVESGVWSQPLGAGVG